MAGNVYNQYVWLLDLIARHDGITFKEISSAWRQSRINDTGAPLSRRTFCNHINKIGELFGIDIGCSSGYKYRIKWSGNIDLRNTQESLLSHIQISNTLFANPRLAGRISLDGYLSFRYYKPLIEAMEEGAVVELRINDRERSELQTVKVAPYFIKQFESDWFMVGKELTTSDICAYTFGSIVAVRRSKQGERYELPEGFSATEFMRAPQFGTAAPNSNETYLRLHNDSISRIRRNRWGSYIPEEYDPIVPDEELQSYSSLPDADTIL